MGTCKAVQALGLPVPTRMDLSGISGASCASGLTRQELDIKTNAFHAGPQPDVLADGSAYAYQQALRRCRIGFFAAEEFSLFPTETAIRGSGRNHHLRSTRRKIKVHATDRVQPRRTW